MTYCACDYRELSTVPGSVSVSSGEYDLQVWQGV
jgi:hypothetical protein